MLKTIYEKKCLVFGCGNPLLGDDGFGPEVIAYLEANARFPEHVTVLDIGTCIRDILFDILLSNNKPEQIIIVDAVDRKGKRPGEIFEIEVDEIPAVKICDYSLHQFPTTNMLKEIREHTSIDVRLLVVQITSIPEVVKPGLSLPVKTAIPSMCRKVVRLIHENSKHPVLEEPS